MKKNMKEKKKKKKYNMIYIFSVVEEVRHVHFIPFLMRFYQ